ncbi:MAG TPA: choice-of-anchor V domain-containing protein, partial [Ignavibacteriaceae bacterium]
MKNYIILIIIFISFITFAYSGLFEYDLLGGTQLNGSGCVCHTLEIDTSVSVWIEGPDTLKTGETGLYRMYLANGPAEAGGYNVAGRFGTMVLVDSFSYWNYLSPNELTQAFPLVFPTPQDTIYWEFGYTAPDSILADTLYSCGLSIVFDTIPDFRDRWNFGPKFPVTIIENIVPVELISFSALQSGSDIKLSWFTATETNNLGFEIERAVNLTEGRNLSWTVIGSIEGNGTTAGKSSYSFVDKNPNQGKSYYRLKQIDFNGS